MPMSFRNLFIHSVDGKAVLYRLDKGQILKIGNLPFPEITKYQISETGLIAAIKIKRRRNKKSFIYVARVDENFKIINECNYEIPRDFHVHAIGVKNEVIYFGGYNRYNAVESAGFIISTEKEKKLCPINIPKQNEMPGKAIDDIMILDNRMILVDNFIYPKYLFEYNISQETNLVLKKVIKLPNNGTYEHIISGKMNHKWIVLFSSTIGMNGKAYHLNILGAHDFKNYGTISSRIPFDNKTSEKYWFHDYALHNDKLYLACGDKGIGWLKLRERLDEHDIKYIDIQGKNEINEIYNVGDEVLVIKNRKYLNLLNTNMNL